MREPMSFFVVGLPKGQPRAKARRFGNVSRVYDPGTADEWKLFVREAANKAWNQVPWVGPLCVNVTFYLPRPKSHFTKKGLRPEAPVFHTSRADLDNFLKGTWDALTNLGLWADDSIIAATNSRKVYAAPAAQSGALIEIKEAI